MAWSGARRCARGRGHGVGLIGGLALIALALAPGSAGADVTITVGTGGCTLPSAITAAETAKPTGGCPAGTTSGLDTIVLPAGTYMNDDLEIASGRITIAGHAAADTIIDASAAGRGFLIDGPATVKLQNITIEQGQTADGTAGSPGASIGGNGGAGGAGGAVSNAGHLTIANCTLTTNRTGNGGAGGAGTGPMSIGGSGGDGGAGGAVFNSGTLTITGSTFSGNITGNGNTGGAGTSISGSGGAGGDGGAIANAGTLTIVGSVVTAGKTGAGGTGGSGGGSIPGNGGEGGSGGGLSLESGSAAITHVSIGANTTGNGGTGSVFGGNGGAGGGIEADGGAAGIVSSTLIGNLTGNGGAGGTFGGNGGSGGGIDNFGPMTLKDSTLASNATGTGAAGGDAGAMISDAPLTSAVTVSDSTFTGNVSQSGKGDAIELVDTNLSLIADTVASNGQTGTSAGGSGIDVISGSTPTTKSTLTEHDTLVAANGATNCVLDANSTLSSQGHNISFPSTTCAHEVAGDPKLGPLKSNGGLARTMALGPGSAVLDQVPSGDSACAHTTDQRGVARPVGAGCDVEAFEVTPVLVGAPTVTTASTAASIRVPLSVGATTSVQVSYGAAHGALSHHSATLTVRAGITPTFVLTGLSPFTAYDYEVTATSSFGSLTSQVLSFSTEHVPSNAFVFVRLRVDRHDRIVITLTDTDAGRFISTSFYTPKRRNRHARLRRPVTFGKGAVSSRGPGKLALTITPTRIALHALKSARSLRVKVIVTFTPLGGKPRTNNRTITVHYRKPPKPRRRR